MDREEIEREIISMEKQLKELKKQYKKTLRSVKGMMSDETKERAREVKKYIKIAEKEIIKAKIQLFWSYKELI